MNGGTAGSGAIHLVVRADDFGMCHAVNMGVRQAWEHGIVTTTTTMAACPWYEEAAAILRETGLPTGVHQTLTCEWDFFRWRPLTNGPSLAGPGPDGTFWRTSEEAEQHGDHEQVVTELLAQVARLRGSGIEPEFLDCHMRTTLPAAFDEVSRKAGVPFLYSDAVALDGLEELTPRDEKDKKPWLLDWLGGLGPGLHMLVSHPGAGGAELSSLTSPGSGPFPWAEKWRVADLEVLTDPDVRQAVDKAGIELVTLRQGLSSREAPAPWSQER